MALQDDLKPYWQEITKGFGSGRHRKQKMATVGVYGGLCLLTVVWSFSGGGGLSNAIGAEISSNSVELSSENFLQLRNDSGDTWTGLKLKLNDKYQTDTLPDVESDDSIQVFVKDFAYEYYVPRPKHPESAASLTAAPTSGAMAPPDLEPKMLEVITDQGTHKVAFSAEGAEEPGQEPGEEAAKEEE